MFSHTEAPKWRDYSGMNTFLLKSIFPSMSYEYSQEFKDRTDSARPFIFDRLLFADRAAALRGPQFAHTWRTAAEAFTLPGSAYWWSPVRRNLLDFVGELPESIFAAGDVGIPVITYVSRQEWGRRMLKKEDHDGLVKALNELKEKHGYEVRGWSGQMAVHTRTLTRLSYFLSRSTSSPWTSSHETNRYVWQLGQRSCWAFMVTV
jgi:hypothetical protein